MSDQQAERISISQQGRIVIPASMRRSLRLRPGDALTIREVDGELRIAPVDRTLQKWQEFAQATIPAGTSLVEELLAERRREVRGDVRS